MRKERFVDCAKCGARLAERSLEQHIDGVLCRSRQTARDVIEEGWIQVTQKHAAFMRSAGVPVREVPASVVNNANFGEELVDVPFVPKGAVSVARVVIDLNFPVPFRKRALAALYDCAPELRAECDAIRRMQGTVRSYVVKLVNEAEQRKKIGNWAEETQGTSP